MVGTTVSTSSISLIKTLISMIFASRDMTVHLVYCSAREGEVQECSLGLFYLAPSSWIRKPMCGFYEFQRMYSNTILKIPGLIWAFH